MAELANCARCGDVFVKTLRDNCQKCFREEEDAFQKVYNFLRIRKNREATILEIVEATGVDESMIIKFVKEKRLTPKDFPMLAYPCERCGNDIAVGKLCNACADELRRDLTQFEEEEKQASEREEKARKNVYFTMNNRKK